MTKELTLAEMATLETTKQINLITAQGDSIFKDLIDDAPAAMVPESIFKEYFLDFFRDLPEDWGNSPLLFKWLEVSNGPYNEVKVIDGNGVLVFTVPGIYNRPSLDQSGLKGTNFNKMASQYSLQSKRMSSIGKNYLNNQLNGIGEQVLVDDGNSEAKWRMIFLHYDKPSVGTLGKAVDGKSTTAKIVSTPSAFNVPDDMLNYD